MGMKKERNKHDDESGVCVASIQLDLITHEHGTRNIIIIFSKFIMMIQAFSLYFK
jgi:hypothetical protein